MFSSPRTGRRLAPALFVAVAAISSGVPLLIGAAPAGATQSSLQAEAAQLSQQLIEEQVQVDALRHQYEVDTAKVAQDTTAVADVAQRVQRDRGRVHADHIRLSNEAVSSYINAGSVTLNQTLQLFSSDQESTSNRTEYENVAIGNTTETLALLHTDQIQLQASQTILELRTQQDREAQVAAANSTAQAEHVTNELAAKQALVKGQLAAAIAADRSQLTTTAVASRVVTVGGAVSDPSLPPFLQCVVRVESGGDYQAVSPGGQYMGAFQFSQPTWNEAAQLAGMPQLIGVPPNQAPKADQDTLALALYDADGQQPWLDGCQS